MPTQLWWSGWNIGHQNPHIYRCSFYNLGRAIFFLHKKRDYLNSFFNFLLKRSNSKEEFLVVGYANKALFWYIPGLKEENWHVQIRSWGDLLFLHPYYPTEGMKLTWRYKRWSCFSWLADTWKSQSPEFGHLAANVTKTIIMQTTTRQVENTEHTMAAKFIKMYTWCMPWNRQSAK